MESLKEPIVKEVLNVEEITEEQIRKDGREYNAREWDKIIDRVSKYEGCKFYVAKPQRGYDYVRYFAVYKIEEGIIFFNSVSYSACLSNGGFCRINIRENGIVERILLKDIHNNYGRCGNDKANRVIMAGNSRKFGAVFSNNF